MGCCPFLQNTLLSRHNDLSRLTYSITYDTTNDPYHVNIVNGNVVPVTNKVRVQLTYYWVPEAFLGGLTMTSTAEMSMSY